MLFSLLLSLLHVLFPSSFPFIMFFSLRSFILVLGYTSAWDDPVVGGANLLAGSISLRAGICGIISQRLLDPAKGTASPTPWWDHLLAGRRRGLRLKNPEVLDVLVGSSLGRAHKSMGRIDPSKRLRRNRRCRGGVISWHCWQDP
jgi:hypothetical protein